MKTRRFTGLFLALVLLLTMFSATTPASAACLRKVIGDGNNNFVNTNIGTAENDIIICDEMDEPTANVRGLAGDDTILVYADPTDPGRDIVGGDVPVDGDDVIVVFEGAMVNQISGDRDTTGGTNPGDDQITLYGSANAIFGDEIQNSTANDRGGDDTIDVFGSVNGTIYGDGIFVSNNYWDEGGNDVITIHEGGQSGNIFGDNLRSHNTSSKGGDDIITVAGLVTNKVYGDHIHSGTGGDDTIVITKTGIVGFGGASNHVFGDSDTGGSTIGGLDTILIDGHVFGNIYGDHADVGAADDIVVGQDGIVEGHIFGDHSTNDGGSNGLDRIVIIGRVKGNVEGDGYRADGQRDYIVVESIGDVDGNIFGDGTFRTAGNAFGREDNITIKGNVDGNVHGDEVDGDGRRDTIVIQGRVSSPITMGRVVGNVVGDEADGNGGADNIILTRYSKVYGGVYGDNSSISGVNGGNDNIQIDGTVGRSSDVSGVYGDHINGEGGDDFIHVEKHGVVYGSVYGDDTGGKGGEDLIWIDGRVTMHVFGDTSKTQNVKDQISVRQGGIVELSVLGDGSKNNTNGGWDVMNIIGGTVGQDFVGDSAGGDGGNDFMAIRMGGLVKRDFIGDSAGTGGDDTMTIINGTVEGDMFGDLVSGDGGNDTMNVLVAGTLNGDLIGDYVGNNMQSGDDSIFISGKVDGRIYGDLSFKNGFAGNDNIQTNPSSVIGNGIWGDNTKGAGGNDTIKVNGKISAAGIRGDVVFAKGGNDNISIFGFGDVKGNVIGDDANGAGGNDTIQITNGGKVTGNVWGDFSKNKGGNDNISIAGLVTGNVEGDHQKGNGTPNGGDDTIVVELTGQVNGHIFGDNVDGNGGDDNIDIRGTVNGNVLGDNVGGSGGNDVIRIFPSGVVGGSVCGFNFCNNNPGDNVVFLDEDANPALDSADTIIIAGKVLGNVIAGTFYGSNADDTVVVIEGAEIGGTVYAGDETNGDSFIYVENIINEEKTISEVVNSVKEHNGKVTVNGATYTLDNVEVVAGAVGQISCFGMDYRMNKASDGCAARSGAEKDAIQWHQDNPGNDGRLPGLEGCAVYPYGDALRVYEIMNGEQGQLVAEIWGDVLIDAPAANELLGATADGNVALYHLASGELQVECRNLVDGKTQVRVLSDLAGTVTDAYDKS